MSDLISRQKALEALTVTEEMNTADLLWLLTTRINDLPAAEPVIRCCDCRWFTDCTKAVSTTLEGEDIEWCMCWIHDDIMPENGFCSKAERKDE